MKKGYKFSSRVVLEPLDGRTSELIEAKKCRKLNRKEFLELARAAVSIVERRSGEFGIDGAVAAQFGVSKILIAKWKQRAKAGQLVLHERGLPNPILNDAMNMNRLREIYSVGPQAYFDDLSASKIWTAELMAKAVEKAFDKKYHPDSACIKQIMRLLDPTARQRRVMMPHAVDPATQLQLDEITDRLLPPDIRLLIEQKKHLATGRKRLAPENEMKIHEAAMPFVARLPIGQRGYTKRLAKVFGVTGASVRMWHKSLPKPNPPQ